MTPTEVVDAARRVYVGTPREGDAGLVESHLRGRYRSLPPDDEARAFWALSLHAGGITRSKYKSVQDWVDKGKGRR